MMPYFWHLKKAFVLCPLWVTGFDYLNILADYSLKLLFGQIYINFCVIHMFNVLNKDKTEKCQAYI